jgi:hypothetical protein
MPVPPLGFVALQGRSPLAEPCALSDADALLKLTACSPLLPNGLRPPREAGEPPRWPQPLNEEAAERATSPPTGPCSLRASVSPVSGLDPPATATLMGFVLPRGFPLHDGDRPSGPSSHGLCPPARKLDRQLPSRVFDRRRGWLDSLEPATPCEVCHLVDPPHGPWPGPAQQQRCCHPSRHASTTATPGR